MGEKLTMRDLIMSALQDAADWQESFADANKGHDEYQYRAAISLAKQYRAELRRMETASREAPTPKEPS